MIPIPEIIEKSHGSSFTVREFTAPCKENIYHFHEEYELTYIVKGKGERFIGGRSEPFKENELILIGSNTPHYFIHDEESRKINETPVIVVHFLSDFLGASVFNIPEFKKLSKLLDKSKVGISFSSQTASKVGESMKKMLQQKRLEKLMSLFEIFNLLIQSEEYKEIGNIGYDGQLSDKNEYRINTIYSYIDKNFMNKIAIEEIADKVHLTPAAFCRFFKKFTRKTFIQYLNEYRIGNACKLLSTTELPVGDIAFKCGFGNMANFNRKFKAETGITPLAYRNKFGRGLDYAKQ